MLAFFSVTSEIGFIATDLHGICRSSLVGFGYIYKNSLTACFRWDIISQYKVDGLLRAECFYGKMAYRN